MIRILINHNSSPIFLRTINTPCNCVISDNSRKLHAFVFNAWPGASVGEEEERCWDKIFDTYGTNCPCGNLWDQIYYLHWETDDKLNQYYKYSDVKLFFEEGDQLITPKVQRIVMPDGTDGLNCNKCENYFPYVEANSNNGYICPTCRLF